MAYTLSAPVCDALKYIYYDMRAGRAADGLALLESASAAGDGDASCILGRCLMGPRYAWKYHRFPVDEKRAKYFFISFGLYAQYGTYSLP